MIVQLTQTHRRARSQTRIIPIISLYYIEFVHVFFDGALGAPFWQVPLHSACASLFICMQELGRVCVQIYYMNAWNISRIIANSPIRMSLQLQFHFRNMEWSNESNGTNIMNAIRTDIINSVRNGSKKFHRKLISELNKLKEVLTNIPNERNWKHKCVGLMLCRVGKEGFERFSWIILSEKYYKMFYHNV